MLIKGKDSAVPIKSKNKGIRNIVKLDSDTADGLFYGLASAFFSTLLFEQFLERGSFYQQVFKTIIICASFSVLYVLIIGIRSSKRKKKIDLLSLISVLILILIIAAIGKFLAFSITTVLANTTGWKAVPESVFYLAIPFAAGPMLLQLVLGWEYSLILTFSLAFWVINYFESTSSFLFLYVLFTSLIGFRSLSRVRSRSSYLSSGLFVAAIAAVLSHLLFIESGFPSYDLYLLTISNALLGGIFCIFITSSFAPLLELVGGYVTDLRLIEMATLDHPVLKELSIQAPGTWNHSMVMGNMAEAAANAISANPVLSRVGAYFHDIGKTKKPLYFVENQFGCENRHDRLSPPMSALIIRSHVKEGLEIAKKYKLPDSIQDMISQHHGTSTIEFFYDKAIKEADGAEIDRTGYQYPGPKPQTKEAGIMMLADGIEAASRTMSDPTYDRIQGMVQKMINKVFASGQLDECDLTLKDLHEIARCFTRVLSGIYHQRISYTEPVEKINSKSLGDKHKNSTNNKESEITNDAVADIRRTDSSSHATGESEERSSSNRENLKRLGLE
jgi:cyclic-di-AMP phosphodiesterase PgpH